MKLFSTRLMYLYAFITVVVMMILAMYLQFWKGVAPCPLCILQRVTLVFLGICFLFGAAFHFKKLGNTLIGLFAFFIADMGVFLSGRQVWIQHLPPNKSADCGASLQYMLQVLPLDQVLKKILQGTADCSQLEWSILGLSLAEWSLIWFVVFAIFAIWQMVRYVDYDDLDLD